MESRSLLRCSGRLQSWHIVSYGMETDREQWKTAQPDPSLCPLLVQSANIYVASAPKQAEQDTQIQCERR